uniref:Reverse transcriptase domain-containing protein n=1 Tax=Panagrellus redivivus TaxID=6233 RepID=A0A7E4ZX88_PANRE
MVSCLKPVIDSIIVPIPDVTRLLATDFDPERPDSSWGFTTSRDTDGIVLVHGGDGITTLPIVLFGSIVMGTVKYIKEHIKAEVSTLGIRLPTDSVISDIELLAISQRISIKLILLV